MENTTPKTTYQKEMYQKNPEMQLVYKKANSMKIQKIK